MEQLPKYQSVKTVQAAPIATVSDTVLTLRVKQADGTEFMNVPVVDNMFARYRPVEGDYYVIYEDGYVSISPKAAFERGYIPQFYPEMYAERGPKGEGK